MTESYIGRRVIIAHRRIAACLAAAVSLALAPRPAGAVSLDVIHTFQSFSTDPFGPKTKLVQGPEALFIGASQDGGTNGGAFGDGTVFAVDLKGNEETLHNFADGTDGDSPNGGLVLGPDGVTFFGVSENGTNENGAIFTIDLSGNFNVIHSFSSGDTADGASPTGDLVLGPDNQTFYGATQAGGANGQGTIFSITTAHSFHHISSFNALNNGANDGGAGPLSGLTIGDDGKLYGVAPDGGAHGDGAVFVATTSGGLTSLHDFSAVDGNNENADGTSPRGILAKDAAGNFFGVANGGGTHGFGTVFKITTSGEFTVIHNFTGIADGAFPISVSVNADGTLCGLTGGGKFAGGSIFVMKPPHYGSTDYSFTGGDDGQIPTSGFVVGTDGNFYGTNSSNGSGSQGDGGVFFRVGVTSKVIEPFDPAAGRFFGLLNNGMGDISITLANSGKVTGKLIAGTEKVSFSGEIDSTTNTGSITLKGSGGTLTLQLVETNGVFNIQGSVAGTSFTALRAAADTGIAITAAGQYSMLVRATQQGGNVAPGGFGTAILKVSTKGVVSIGGKMPDGEALRSAGLLLQDTNGEYRYSFFDSADLQGSVSFSDQADTDFTGIGTWVVAAKKSKDYPDGFTASLTLDGAQYVAPAKGDLAVPFANTMDNGHAEISGGGLGVAINEVFTLSAANKVAIDGADTEKLKISVNAARGTFSGSFVEPDQKKTSSFSGVLWQKVAEPGGFAGFLGPASAGTSASGSVQLSN